MASRRKTKPRDDRGTNFRERCTWRSREDVAVFEELRRERVLMQTSRRTTPVRAYRLAIGLSLLGKTSKTTQTQISLRDHARSVEEISVTIG